MIETNRLVGFALWCVLLHLSQVPVSSSNTPRIVGGEEASPGAYPFFAFVLTEVADGRIPCGGVLIHQDIVLTAASRVPDNYESIQVVLS
jgi:secreted trypsin-like serine protease